MNMDIQNERGDAARGSRREGAPVRSQKPGVLDFLAGEKREVMRDLKPFLPQELVGGALPHIPGAEEESVWNAASQACSTERVHFCYSIDEGRIWYLACPSSQLASNPDSWCPLAAALPGNSEYWDKETVYLYEQEGVASALRWDPETGRMQVYLGAARTILPRIQTMDANFVTINPDVADVVPWKNRAIRTEKLSRATARLLVLSGLAVNFIIMLVLAVQLLLTHSVQRDLSQVQMDTQNAVTELMQSAASTMQNTSIQHMVNVQELLDALVKIDGTLIRYEIKGGNRAEWEALVPQAYSSGVGIIRGTVQPEIEPDGRVRISGTR
ncbi:MAG: hypothetical protein H6855_03010 [Rhodospirillales bacterium]|nr:hypothetical protein [Rhodospirillales bacterium]MCB9965036.1 hypothetical protein [Rhodospirillales bacterium]MCB9980364.1 hypothetical protein [Rhodospirillales bacterium]